MIRYSADDLRFFVLLLFVTGAGCAGMGAMAVMLVP
jgi:hypothetical protein